MHGILIENVNTNFIISIKCFETQLSKKTIMSYLKHIGIQIETVNGPQ